MTNYFTWSEFDKSVDYISDQCQSWELSGIYGVPRGGLILAVALSHKLDIKLIEKPSKNSLIVDDIFETGLTLSNFRHIEGVNFFPGISKFGIFSADGLNLNPRGNALMTSILIETLETTFGGDLKNVNPNAYKGTPIRAATSGN